MRGGTASQSLIRIRSWGIEGRACDDVKKTNKVAGWVIIILDLGGYNVRLHVQCRC